MPVLVFCYNCGTYSIFSLSICACSDFLLFLHLVTSTYSTRTSSNSNSCYQRRDTLQSSSLNSRSIIEFNVISSSYESYFVSNRSVGSSYNDFFFSNLRNDNTFFTTISAPDIMRASLLLLLHRQMLSFAFTAFSRESSLFS